MRRTIAALLGFALMTGLVVALPGAEGATEVRIVAAGDFGARAATRGVLDGMVAANPTAAVALGDLAYNDVASESAWCAFVKQSTGEGFPFQLVSGNHDTVDQSDGLINNFSACLPNQVPGIAGTYGREYVMDFPRTSPLVRVIGVSPGLTFEDGVWNYAAGDAHYQWLSNAIDSGRAAGARWIVVAAHKPCFSVGTYSCASVDFTRLLLGKRVDLVLHGHEHGYMRTHQLASGLTGCTTVPAGSFDADCVRDSDNAYQGGAGTVFATVGTGGIPLRDVNAADTEAGYFAAWSGLNANPASGFLDIQADDTALRASFVNTSGGTFSDSFTIGAGGPPANTPPTASFTSTTAGLAVSVNGSGSFDSEAAIASYAWDFGDTATASGATATHTYSAPGTYTVGLTVTDAGGLTNSTTRQVTVANGPVELARDAFGRTVAGSFGTADAGGAWVQASVSASSYSVDGATGRLQVAPGASRLTTLRSLSLPGADARISWGFSGALSGGGMYASLAPRVMTDGSAYRAKVRLYPSGAATLSLVRATSTGVETALASASTSLSGVTTASRVLVRTQVVGASPTTLRAKFWLAGNPEPASWQAQVTDSTAALQGSGAVGVHAYTSSTATSTPTALVDDLLVTAP